MLLPSRHFRRNPRHHISVVTSTHIARRNNRFPHRVLTILYAILAAALISTLRGECTNFACTHYTCISSGASLNPVDPLAVCFAPPFSFVRWACALQYCFGAISTSLSLVPNSISENTGNGCTVPPNVVLTLSGANLPSGTASTGAVLVRFAGGTVQSQAIIVVQGPSSAVAPTKVPMVVLISGSTFLSGSAVKVSGSYPPHSNITIANNAFTSQEHCAPLGVIGYFVTVIAFIDTVPIVLGEGAAISAQYNNISTNSGTLQHSVPFIVTSITFNNGSSASIRGNTVRTHGDKTLIAQNTWTIYFDVYPTPNVNVIGNTGGSRFRFLGGGGAWLFEENMIYISTDVKNHAVLGNSPHINSTSGGSFSISRNYINASPLPDTSEGTNVLISLSSTTNASNFDFLIDGNTFEGYGRQSAMNIPQTILGGHSLLSISGNIFTSNEASVGLRIVINPSTISNNSLLRIDNNTFLSPQGAARAHAITLITPIRLQDTATLSLVGNSVDATVRSNTYKLIAASAANALSVAPTARVYSCGTRYNGEAVRSLLRFRAFAADATFGLIPIEYCPQTSSASVTQSSSVAILSLPYSRTLSVIWNTSTSVVKSLTYTTAGDNVPTSFFVNHAEPFEHRNRITIV